MLTSFFIEISAKTTFD